MNPYSNAQTKKIRPCEDGIPPISLLYDGFGEFFDILEGTTAINGFTNIKILELQLAVDEFAESMCRFFKDEDARRDKGLELLNKIFAARQDALHLTIAASSIGSVRTDGHHTGGHGVATVINGHSKRLEEWRVPASLRDDR
jgi:hypothetical protein